MGSEFDLERFGSAHRMVQQCDALPFVDIKPRLRVYASVTSTNQIAWELMDQDEIEPVAIALQQTAGRGQWGRQWQSAPGGLYLSVGVQLKLPIDHAAQLTLCTAWGLAIALRQIPAKLSGVTEGIPVQIKWLNDLVLQGRKLGGILTETRIQQEQITKAVIGVGLNWTNPVPETGINLQEFLAHHPIPLIESLELLAAIALQGIFSGIRQMQVGIDPILRDYVNLLAHRDRPIEWDGKTWAIVGIAPTGELRVREKFLESPDPSKIQPVSPTEILIQPGTISLGYPLNGNAAEGTHSHLPATT
ncbi:MAG: biotin--[acetyl-CoA-carboxylase] ligase [Leptolyngbyaceae cyanobacterium bins.349]|nr:biotin--[acetyl-CoA-carboxylase] ligase [Leptolyngbyaceae cyanobacterium bins.349]